MGRIFPSVTTVKPPEGRIFNTQDNPSVEPLKWPTDPTSNLPKRWEDMSFGEKIWEFTKELPRTLYQFVPPSSREVLEKRGPLEINELGKAFKGGFEFAGGIAQVMGQAAGGAFLGGKQLFTGKGERVNVPLLGEVASYQEQAQELEKQGFSSGEARALVGVNAYLGLVPFGAKAIKTRPLRAVAGRVTTKEIPFAETPTGMKLAVKGEVVPEERVRIERPTITRVKQVFGKTEEQRQFGGLLEQHLDRYFEGRSQILDREDPLNKALLKLNDVELKSYSYYTQGLTTIDKPSPALKNALELWTKTNQEIEADLIARGKLTAEQVENRRWKPVEMITGRSRDELSSMGVEPVYYPYLAEDLLKRSDFIATTGRRTKGGYLKRFTGKLLREDSYIKNPTVAIPRHRMQVFRDKMNNELVDSIRSNFAEKDPTIIKFYKTDPSFAEAMGVVEWKPTGPIRFYPQRIEEVVRIRELPEIKPALLVKDTTRIEELRLEIEALDEALKQNPARELSKYVNKRTGELPEVVGGSGGKFRRHGDDIASELGFPDSETARLAYLDYSQAGENLKILRQELRETKKGTFKEYSQKQIDRINSLLARTNELVTRQRTIIGVTHRVESYWIPKTIADELNRFYRPGAIEKLLRMTYDPIIDLWRVSVLNLVPRWLYNNFVGNTMLAIAAKTDPLAFAKSAKEMFARTKIGQRIGVSQRDIAEGTFVKRYAGGELPEVGRLGALPTETTQFLRPLENWLNLLEQAKNYRALRLPALLTQGLIKGWIALGKPGGYLNRVIENWFRAAVYISKTEGKFLGLNLEKPVPPAEGLRYVNEFLFDYTKLTRAERATFRRALPFWNWMKNITEFSFKLPARHPLRGLIAGALLQDYVDYINDINQAEDRVKTVLRIKTDMTYQNKPLYINVRSAIPYTDVFSTIPVTPEQWRRLFTANPVSRIIAERVFRINAFTGLPFTQPAALQEFDEFGRPIPPLPPVPRHIGMAIPQVKLGEAISDITRFGAPIRRFETGEPKIVRGGIQVEDWLFPILRYFGISVSPIEINRIRQQTERKERRQEVKRQVFERQVKTQLERLRGR